MRPHDELLHYGIRGMKWGVRNAIGNRYGRSAARSEGAARTQRGIANSVRGKAGFVGKGIAKVYDKSASGHEKAARNQRKIESTLKKPMPRQDQKRHMTTFQKTVLGIGTGVLIGGVLSPLVRPTFDMYGKAMRDYVANRGKDDIFKVAKTIGKTGGELYKYRN